MLTPVSCTPNRQDFVERPYNLQVATDGPVQPLHIIHMAAWVGAGTNIQYEWNFGDGTTRIDTGAVSHVYSPTVPNPTYTVIVTATNGYFPSLTESTSVEVRDTAVPGVLPDTAVTGCREETPGRLTFELISRNKHGLSGNLLLAELTFTTAAEVTSGQTQVGLPSIQLVGPSYEQLQYNIAAGNPVYAPTPMRGLLDVQPCPQTQAADMTALALLEGLQEHAVGARRGRYGRALLLPVAARLLPHRRARDRLGLVDPQSPTTALPDDKRVGKCVPWLDKLPTGTVSVEFQDYSGQHNAGRGAAGGVSRDLARAAAAPQRGRDGLRTAEGRRLRRGGAGGGGAHLRRHRAGRMGQRGEEDRARRAPRCSVRSRSSLTPSARPACRWS